MKPIIVTVLLLLNTTLAVAQSESGRAALEGRVTDPSGAVVPGASITVRETNTGFIREAASNEEGHFHIGALPVGSYLRLR
jgi:hypothetical protein